LPARDSIFVELGYHRYQVRLDDAPIGSEEAKISHGGGGDNRPVGRIAQGWARRGDFKGERDDLEWEMTRRGIPLALVQAVMDQPEQRLSDDSGTGRWIHQPRLRFEDGKMYLLRVVVDEDEHPPGDCHRLPDQQD
jgi:hypothetical protein